jgi:hypothetical protein
MSASTVRVIHRHLRWEVSTNGVIRPLHDWLCTRERAVDHAFERAREDGVDLVTVETAEGTVRERLRVPTGPAQEPWYEVDPVHLARRSFVHFRAHAR